MGAFSKMARNSMAASGRAQNNGPYAGARAGPPMFTATPGGASSRVPPVDANAARIAELEAQLAAMRGANNPFQETTACAKSTSPVFNTPSTTAQSQMNTSFHDQARLL